jgi:hypothetical protein
LKKILTILPITTKGKIGRAAISIPKENVAELAEIMQNILLNSVTNKE